MNATFRAVLLRLLFPSWAFFDAVHEVPALEIRTWRGAAPPGPWRAALAAPPRRWYALLFNADGNEHLARQAIVDRFAVEQAHHAPDAVTLALVHALARQAVVADDPRATHDRWQWRVVAVPARRHDGANPDPRVLFEHAVCTTIPTA